MNNQERDEIFKKIQARSELKTHRFNVARRDYRAEILTLLKDKQDKDINGYGGIGCTDLKNQMKCSNLDFYIFINCLLHEDKITRESDGTRAFYYLK